MSTPNISAPEPADGNGFLAQLLPNRGRARFLRVFIRIFLAVGVIGGLSLIWDVYADFHARHTWPVADGEVLSASQKSFKRDSGGNQYGKAHEVLGGIRSEICCAGRSMQDGHNLR